MILGMDPGLANTGFAVVSRAKRAFRVLESGCAESVLARRPPRRGRTPR